ncbi:MAG: hypothetical protein KGY76_09810 [Candidatus Thermoplasmatota archaeon]|nr:hypothetical protein [Candidatus Thermoplasmatota archaeon]
MVSSIRRRRALLQAVLILIFLVGITSFFTYPAQIWFVSIIGGAVSAVGVFFKRKMLITTGIVAIGATYYFSNINLEISPFNIILFSGFFILFYGCGLFVHEFTRLDIILKGSKGERDELLEQYIKKWKFSAFKYLALSFLVAFTASMISIVTSFDQSVYQGETIPFAASLLFAVSAIVLTFLLIVKLPALYENID